MLNVYTWSRCPHCRRTIEWLRKHRIEFRCLEVEEQPEDVIRKVVEANGGDDWVVPTMEYSGQWRPGQAYDPAKLEEDMRGWGLVGTAERDLPRRPGRRGGGRITASGRRSEDGKDS